MQVAQTILAQLGADRFCAMTGARSFIGEHRALRFALPCGSARDGINWVRVELTADDLYTMTFYHASPTKGRQVAQVVGVYADKLQAAFTAATGLDTHL